MNSPQQPQRPVKLSRLDDVDVRLVHDTPANPRSVHRCTDRPRSMRPETFRAALTALLHGAAESGLDLFFIHNELTLAGMQLLDEARCDLVDADHREPPF